MDRMAPSCSSMPVKRSSTRRSASGSPASRRDVESARAAEGPLPAAAAVVVAVVAPAASALATGAALAWRSARAAHAAMAAAIQPRLRGAEAECEGTVLVA